MSGYFLLSSALANDIVILRNGDRISGEIQKLESGRLTLSTSYAGTVRIEWKQVQSLRSDQEYLIYLESGEVVAGSIRPAESGHIQVTAEEHREVDLVQVLQIQKDVPPLPQPRIWEAWKGNVDLGYALIRGNREIENLTFSFRPERETALNRIQLNLRTLRSVQDGVVASSLYDGQLRFDRFYGPRGFLFGLGGYEKDIRRGLTLRTTQGAGFGLRFEPWAHTRLNLLGGVNFLQERFNHEPTDLGAEALAGLELETRLFSHLVLSSRSQFLPVFTEDRYRFNTDLNVRLPLFLGLTFGIQIFDHYDSNPPRVGLKKNDIGITSTFGYTFGQ